MFFPLVIVDCSFFFLNKKEFFVGDLFSCAWIVYFSHSCTLKFLIVLLEVAGSLFSCPISLSRIFAYHGFIYLYVDALP